MTGNGQTAHVYRMVMPGLECPYGIKAVDLLRREGFRVEDHHLTTREQTDAFKAEHGVKTTPQTFVAGERVGGYDDLRSWLGRPVRRAGETTYRPVLAIFGMAAAIALALSLYSFGRIAPLPVLEWFVSVSMCLLALQKLQDVEAFSTSFLNYDLLARRWVPYGRIYPYAEGLAGVLMVGHLLPLLSVPLSLFIGTVGAVSVFKAVYIDKRTLKCACVGGNSNVPLGFVSLTENLFMVGMGLWMGAKLLNWV